MTNKEWETAKREHDSYYLALVTNIENTPNVNFIKNPAKVLKPKYSIIATIQLNWNVNEKELQKAINVQ